MPEATETMTVRLSARLKKRLTKLAKATARSNSWLAADAIRSYLDVQEWQIEGIKAGIREADAGEFSPEEQVEAVIARWRRDAS